MTPLEQLRPFVYLSQASGLIPFTIEQDSITKNFSRFSFHIKSFVTIWCVVILVSHAVVFIALAESAKNLVIKMSASGDTPITLNILMGIFLVCYVFHHAATRWIIFRHYNRLKNAFDTIQNLENYFAQTMQRNLSSVTKRFTVGFTLIVISASTVHTVYH